MTTLQNLLTKSKYLKFSDCLEGQASLKDLDLHLVIWQNERECSQKSSVNSFF